MDHLKTTRLTAAKICHEISGYLSVMKFLQEDLKSCENDDLKMLLDDIDLLSYTMDFFRNLYSASKAQNITSNNILNIYKYKGVLLKGAEEVFDSLLTTNEEDILSCILYIIMKSCRKDDVVSIDYTNDVITINATVPLATGIIKALNHRSCEEDIFNVLAKYANYLAYLEKYAINAENDKNNNLRIKLWKE